MRQITVVKRMLNSLKIGYYEETLNNEISIMLETNKHRKVTGYKGFFIEITFTLKGKFKQIGAWK